MRGLSSRRPGAHAVRVTAPQGPCRAPRDGRKGRPPCVPRLWAAGPLGEQKWPDIHAGAWGRGEPSPLTKVNSLRHFASGHREQDGPTAVLAGLGRGGQDTRCVTSELPPLVPLHPGLSSFPGNTHLLVLLQGNTGLSPILGLNKEQLVPLDVLEDALRERHQGGQGVGRQKD